MFYENELCEYDRYDHTEFLTCRRCGKELGRAKADLCHDCYIATHPEEFHCEKGHFAWNPKACTACWEESLSKKRKEVR